MIQERLAEHRAKDVLFGLSVAGERNRPLGRLALQKLIYLFDVLALVWREVGADSKFRPWHNGPYDPAIQNAVDMLGFRGLVEIHGLAFRKLKNAGCKYSLSAAGQVCVSELRKKQCFEDDYLLFVAIAAEIDKRGWEKIKEIVYAEPTYGSARASRHPLALPIGDSDGNLSAQLLKSMKRALELDRALPVSRNTLVQLMFAMIDQYRTLPEAK